MEVPEGQMGDLETRHIQQLVGGPVMGSVTRLVGSSSL